MANNTVSLTDSHLTGPAVTLHLKEDISVNY